MGDAGVQALSRGASPKGLGLGEGHRCGGGALDSAAAWGLQDTGMREKHKSRNMKIV